MKVGLNLLHARPEIGGAWNYIGNVLELLPMLGDGFQFVAYCTPASATIVPNYPNLIRKIVRFGSSSQIARICYEQSILPFVAYLDKLDCLHWFANNGPILNTVPSVVTVHDMMFLDTPVDRPTRISRLKRIYLHEMARYTCQHARVLAPVSRATAEVAKRLFAPKGRLTSIIPNPLDPEFCPAASAEVADFRRRHSLPQQFFLYVAHPYPHKNHARLFAAYKRLRDTTKRTWPLVLRADREKGGEALDRTLAEQKIEGAVIWLPRLSQHDMASLYSAATVLIFPSLYEGCGLPVLEAMACGCPVAASDIATTVEFAGEAAFLFDPTSVDSICEAMRALAQSPDRRQYYSGEGLRRVERYRPNRVVESLLAAYECAAPQLLYAPSK